MAPSFFAMEQPVISVRDITIRYRGKDSVLYAVDGASFDLERGKVLALVGESGSGKSTAGMSILRILPTAAEIISGSITFEGRDLLSLPEAELRAIRGRRISMIFQDPIAGLNPVVTIGDQVAEMLTNHERRDKKEVKRRAIEILHGVGLADPARVAKAYPFQLSGGMCQRVMIGIATALDPEVLIADEPTSALDVTIQAQILYQLNVLRQERGTSILLITHDFGVGLPDGRRCGRHVCGTCRRDRCCWGDVQGSAAPLHARAAGYTSPGRCPSRTSSGDPRESTGSRGTGRALPVHSTMQQGHERVQA